MGSLRLPNHLALIPDGNRRWARRRGLKPWLGHEEGLKVVRKFLDWCLELGIPQISIYTLSTENLNRSKEELTYLFKLIQRALEEYEKDAIFDKYEVKVNFFGEFRRLPSPLLKVIRRLMKKTKNYRKRVLNILIAYGGRWELTRAIKRIVKYAVKKSIRITPKVVEKNLCVQTPIDLIIRTGAYSRLSNFMLWQAAYAEIYVTKTLLPDFTKREFMKALEWYSSQKRKFGR